MALLTSYHWPGAIRELEDTVERAVVLAPEREITLDLLPPLGEAAVTHEIAIGTPLEEGMMQVKRSLTERTL